MPNFNFMQIDPQFIDLRPKFGFRTTQFRLQQNGGFLQENIIKLDTILSWNCKFEANYLREVVCVRCALCCSYALQVDYQPLFACNTWNLRTWLSCFHELGEQNAEP